MTIHRKDEAWIKTKNGSHWMKEQEKQELAEAEEERK
jgi:hypothetical protein